MGIKGKEYRGALDAMTEELVAMARWAKASGARIVVIFEGRDTAGKGGAISAVRDQLNPRQCRVVALPKPMPCKGRLGLWVLPDDVEATLRALVSP